MTQNGLSPTQNPLNPTTAEALIPKPFKAYSLSELTGPCLVWKDFDRLAFVFVLNGKRVMYPKPVVPKPYDRKP